MDNTANEKRAKRNVNSRDSHVSPSSRANRRNVIEYREAGVSSRWPSVINANDFTALNIPLFRFPIPSPWFLIAPRELSIVPSNKLYLTHLTWMMP